MLTARVFLHRCNMGTDNLKPSNTEFVLLAFEGPDLYSLAGGLGVRVTNLAATLAEFGFKTHIFYIGDPELPGQEIHMDGNLILHRWCQWISRFHPLGVYQNEEGKMQDYASSLPPYVIEHIARPALAAGKRLVVLGEDWHTVEAMSILSDGLYESGLRNKSVLLWNANNTTGFDRINWQRLDFVSTITTVSRYMKQLIRGWGVNPLVIPNGIPATLLQPINSFEIALLRQRICSTGNPLLFKVGRFDPAKSWLMAVEAVKNLKTMGQHPVLIGRGGIEEHGKEVISTAHQMGLHVVEVEGQPENALEAGELIQQAGKADIYNLRFHMTQDMLRPFYAAADVVLANSKHEPFGLVGLEAMAAGGIVFTGPTGESYSVTNSGALSLDTETPDEIVHNYLCLKNSPERIGAMRKAARRTAAMFTWEKVLDILFEKVCFAAHDQGTFLPQASYPISSEVKTRPVNPQKIIWHPNQTYPLTRHPEMDVALPG
jgi:glycosyltransferase involved in cell wall biosynthesis